MEGLLSATDEGRVAVLHAASVPVTLTSDHAKSTGLAPVKQLASSTTARAVVTRSARTERTLNPSTSSDGAGASSRTTASVAGADTWSRADVAVSVNANLLWPTSSDAGNVFEVDEDEEAASQLRSAAALSELSATPNVNVSGSVPAPDDTRAESVSVASSHDDNSTGPESRTTGVWQPTPQGEAVGRVGRIAEPPGMHH